MRPKPKQWRQKYASIFQDVSVVQAYQHRPPYPPQIFELLANLIPSQTPARAVLDAGCGTGFISRAFAPYVDRVDAVDISAAMIAMGESLPGGDDPRIRWMCGPLESAPLQPPYALIVAAASLHWLEWEIVLPRFADSLVADGYLAVVEEFSLPNPWDAEIGAVLGQYSMNKDFQPYTMLTVVEQLEERGLFRRVGLQETPPAPFEQPVAAWVESYHARNGFSRDRMDPQLAQECDRRLTEIITAYCPTGVVAQQLYGRVIWGKPLRPPG